jgi:hypothetical protein
MSGSVVQWTPENKGGPPVPRYVVIFIALDLIVVVVVVAVVVHVLIARAHNKHLISVLSLSPTALAPPVLPTATAAEVGYRAPRELALHIRVCATQISHGP